ncbi:hypothetical protein LSH36_317g01048 [Paralvinella palmiformis]|uniref:Prolyl 4-hydroxylase N-terminal domain-containing protein n=1 Tax=Paralvinella palmiformis TaxID=53620 RepID=A0AAD9JGP6_9ANNE|nr:hypothetical protein LSH36_317g01048 [Paralvinella palmiformis]
MEQRNLFPALGLVYLIVIGLVRQVDGEVFDSIANLKALVQHEDWLVEKVQAYIANEEERLKTIKNQLDRITSWSDLKETLDPLEWNKYITETVEHPVNAFNLIKDWRELSNLASRKDHFSGMGLLVGYGCWRDGAVSGIRLLMRYDC